MSFNSFFSKFGNNNSSAGMKIYENQAVENAPPLPAEEFILPDKSENTFGSREKSIETESPLNFDDAFEVITDKAPETIQAESTEHLISFDKPVAGIDESDPDALLELDDLFAVD